MAFEPKAANVKAPFSDGVNPSNVRRFTSGVSFASALPQSWSGKYVRIKNEDGANDARYFFSRNQAAIVGVVAAGADGAPNTQLGEILFARATEHVRLPYWSETETMYFVRAAAAGNPVITITEGSD
jgi:hypothetical protein